MDTATPAAPPRPARGRPGHDSDALRARNADWLAMREQLGWSHARIARHVGRARSAVQAGLNAARRDRARHPAVALPELVEFIHEFESDPAYDDNKAVRDWIAAQRA